MFKLKNLTKRYDSRKVFDNISYEFPTRGLTCVLGASGCGKSTLVNVLAGFDTTFDGNVSFEDTDLSTLSQNELSDFRRDNIGFVFQDYHLLEGLTSLQNVLMSVFSDKSQTQRAIDILTSLGLASKIDQKVENLSGGQKQRVSIARALIKNPKVILADEPTGALDRKTSTEVMKLFKELSQDRLVIIITHDNKICEYADSILKIQDGKIIEENIAKHAPQHDKNVAQASVANSISTRSAVASSPVMADTSKANTAGTNTAVANTSTYVASTVTMPSSTKLSLTLFKRDLLKYIAIGTAIAFGIIAFMMSLSFSNTIQKGIYDFQEKNTAFNNGFVKNADKENFTILLNDDRVENVFYQYKLQNITLKYGEKTSELSEKVPTPKATNVMSYGVMPRISKNEIAITPSLAKKFESNINNLIGKQMTLEVDGKSFSLTVSGIFNAGYDDFFVSSDIEKTLYENKTETPFSISFDVKSFEDVLTVIPYLAESGIEVKSAYGEILNLNSTFNNVKKLFVIVSVLILAVGLFIATLLTVKMQHSKIKEFGLLSSLGYHSATLRNVVVLQNLLLGAIAVVLNLLFVGISLFFPSFGGFTIPQVVLSALLSLLATSAIGFLASIKQLKLDPSTALRIS